MTNEVSKYEEEPEHLEVEVMDREEEQPKVTFTPSPIAAGIFFGAIVLSVIAINGYNKNKKNDNKKEN